MLGDGDDAAVGAEPDTSIVVGHDRSVGADVALEVTLQIASELKAPVTIVRAWSMLTAPRPADWSFGYVSSVDELAEAVQAELVQDTQNLVARFPDVAVTYRAYHAGPAKSLIEASRDAADAGRRVSRAWRVQRDGAGFGQRPVRPLRPLPGARRQAAHELTHAR